MDLASEPASIFNLQKQTFDIEVYLPHWNKWEK